MSPEPRPQRPRRAPPEPAAPHGRRSWARRLPRFPVVMGLVFVTAVMLLSARTFTKLNVPGSPDDEYWAFADFRDAIYYPVVSFLDGNNPYDAGAYARDYPVGNKFRLYSPLTLLVHLPLGFLPFELAEFVYYLLTVALTLALARLTLSACRAPTTTPYVLGVASCMMLSRPGHWNLLLGQYTVPLVIATYVALRNARTRPALAGIGLAFATIKPTYGAPLAILMLCGRDVRAVLIGLGVAGAGAAIAGGLIVHAAGGMGALVESLLRNYEVFETDGNVNPISSPFRPDVPALIGRLLGGQLSLPAEVLVSIAVLGVGAFCVRRLAHRDDDRSRLLSDGAACLAIVLAVYHQSYDLLLAALPLTALAIGPAGRTLSPGLRGALLLLLGLPWLNYVATGTAIEALRIEGGWWLLMASFNGVAMLTALVLFAACTARSRDG